MICSKTIKEIDEDLTRLTNLLKTSLNDGDKREARANIDRLLGMRYQTKEQNDAIQKLPDINILKEKLGKDKWEEIMQNCMTIEPLEE